MPTSRSIERSWKFRVSCAFFILAWNIVLSFRWPSLFVSSLVILAHHAAMTSSACCIITLLFPPAYSLKSVYWRMFKYPSLSFLLDSLARSSGTGFWAGDSLRQSQFKALLDHFTLTLSKKCNRFLLLT